MSSQPLTLWASQYFFNIIPANDLPHLRQRHYRRDYYPPSRHHWSSVHRLDWMMASPAHQAANHLLPLSAGKVHAQSWERYSCPHLPSRSERWGTLYGKEGMGVGARSGLPGGGRWGAS
jgi:hypothetical protein